MRAIPRYYSFKVTLLEVKPKIWRAFLLRDTATFHEWHAAIHDACGWKDNHLFQFLEKRRNRVIAGVPGKHGFGPADPSTKRLLLASHFGQRAGQRCLYEYDFGNCWLHEAVVTEIVERPGRAKRVVLGGDLAFRPEALRGAPFDQACVAAVTGKGWTKDMGGKGDRTEFTKWIGE